MLKFLKSLFKTTASEEDLIKLDIIKLAADSGDAEAQFMLGSALFAGKVMKQNYHEAFKWLSKSASKGNIDALGLLGYQYQNGLGVAQDTRKAIEVYTMSAVKGQTSSSWFLGTLYLEGNGIGKDSKQALRWFRLSAEGNNADSQAMLAGLYYHGEGVKKDLTTAYFWAELARAGGNLICNKLSPHIASELSPEDIRRAVAQIDTWRPIMYSKIPTKTSDIEDNIYNEIMTRATFLADSFKNVEAMMAEDMKSSGIEAGILKFGDKELNYNINPSIWFILGLVGMRETKKNLKFMRSALFSNVCLRVFKELVDTNRKLSLKEGVEFDEVASQIQQKMRFDKLFIYLNFFKLELGREPGTYYSVKGFVKYFKSDIPVLLSAESQDKSTEPPTKPERTWQKHLREMPVLVDNILNEILELKSAA